MSTLIGKELEGDWNGDTSFGAIALHVKVKLTNQPGDNAVAQV